MNASNIPVMHANGNMPGAKSTAASGKCSPLALRLASSGVAIFMAVQVILIVVVDRPDLTVSGLKVLAKAVLFVLSVLAFLLSMAFDILNAYCAANYDAYILVMSLLAFKMGTGLFVTIFRAGRAVRREWKEWSEKREADKLRAAVARLIAEIDEVDDAGRRRSRSSSPSVPGHLPSPPPTSPLLPLSRSPSRSPTRPAPPPSPTPLPRQRQHQHQQNPALASLVSQAPSLPPRRADLPEGQESRPDVASTGSETFTTTRDH